MIRNRKALGAATGKTADLAGEAELDSVNDAALP
jgi:hypothetical protein